MDNASNNDTFISALQRSLILRGIEFSGSQQRIRYVKYSLLYWSNLGFFIDVFLILLT
jgi:hypothetical protein